MYNVKDNAESKLNFWISSIATSLIVDEWTGSLFPIPPFIAVLNKRDEDGKILKSEKIEVTDVDGDQFTVNRWFDNSEATDTKISALMMACELGKRLESYQTELKANLSEDEYVELKKEYILASQKFWQLVAVNMEDWLPYDA